MFDKKIDEIVKSLTESDLFSGVILIQKGDDILFSRAYGYASRTWRIINALDMAFPTASATKMFTAAGIAHVIEWGMLSFDSKVKNILKLEGSLIPPETTVHHLLTHTSGIPDYIDEATDEDEFTSYEDLWKFRPNYSVRQLADFLPLIPNRFPAFEAGSEFQYCNAGYILLGLMIEKVTKLSYFQFIHENVFNKAGMTNSGFFPLDSVSENMVDGHIPIHDDAGRIIDWRRNIYAVPPRGASDAGAFSSAPDLAKFLRSLRECRLVSQKLTDILLLPRGLINKEKGATWCYGYGLAFVLDSKGVVRYGHGGDDPGVSVKIFHYPRQGIDLIILGNQSHCASEIDNLIHGMILQEEIK